MSEATKESVRQELDKLVLPGEKQSLLASGFVSTIVVDGGQVGIVLDFGDRAPANPEYIRDKVEKAVCAAKGVTAANVVLTAAKPAKPAPTLSGPKPTPAPPSPTEIPGVKHIIAVASGKGGVGKSTTSVNLALALKELGYSVGILDADIFGPSLPMLMGIDDKPEVKNGVIQPLYAYGMKVMSIGFLIDVDQPVVWRGPRVMGATQQLLRDVAWGPLDILVVDMPPGTGDVQLTMVQQAPLTGAIIVSTPQDLALIDARKGLAMFRKVGVPILGIVENMSSFHCPECGHEAHIFGHGGAADTAAELKCRFLGGIPLHIKVREYADAGTPIVVEEPESPVSEAYRNIAKQVAETVRG